MDPSPKSSNNKFVESGKKSKSEYRVKILVDSIKWKELHMHPCKKHPRMCPNNMIDSEEFFLFTVVFFQHFALFSFLCPFLLFFLFFVLPFRVIYYDFRTLFSIHVWVRCWEFFCPRSPFLEPSTLSCKAVCLLFRHHLHIKTARGLAEQHLMRR